MLVAAALVPDTVLLLAGVAGGADADPVLRELRTAARHAVGTAVRDARRVVVVAPGGAVRSVAGDLDAGAGAAGVPDALLAEPVPHVRVEADPLGPPPAGGGPGTGAVVGLRLALAAGVPAAGLHVVEVAPEPVALLRGLGERLVGEGPTALVVVGSGSARHGEGAPLPTDPRADVVDAGLVAALRSGSAAARAALAGLDRGLAAALAATGWAPWQVLVGALDASGTPAADPAVGAAAVWHGAAHAVAGWQVAA